jgi:putative FmdB family regulatory protein
MPLYEYQCEQCDHRFELIRKFSDPPLEVCPKCGGRVRKLMSSPAIQFKGTGWYITDYAKKDQGGSGKSSERKADEAGSAAAKSESTSEAKTDSKTEAKSETKPAAKTDSKSDSKA